MNVHEYQAKAILRDYGVPVPRGQAAFTPEEAVAVTKDLGGPVFVVKAQIHAGGRGKGHFKEPEAGEKGGVRIAKPADDVRLFADQMLTHTLVTVQTGPNGRVVKRLLIEEGAAIARELYLSFVVDRASSRVAIIASTEGGMDIEEVAAKTPEKILTLTIDPASGYSQFYGRQVAFALGLKDAQIKQCVTLIGNLYRAFTEKDMSLLEINPLIVTEKGDLVCLDAKLNFDGNALFRHPEIVSLRDLDEEDPAEVLASRYDLSYVKLDGDIGCLVNGAGLAMATMDIIKL
ncbi:MAG: ADP-forming succinate--CoA ligase subunit beta, partial [Rhodomicrobium sp.]|nr:ADP-forming succinate--CoA ligase subunit beta [Rhodomicrobium sp.]